MRGLLQLLWLAGLVQVAIASANLFLPAKLKYRENLSRVSPIIRQIFVVHSIYIVGVVLLFAALTFGFAGELASGHGLGRFLAAAIAVFWLFSLRSSFSITTPRCGKKTAGEILPSSRPPFFSRQHMVPLRSPRDCEPAP